VFVIKQPLFLHGPSPTIKLILFTSLSLGLMMADHHEVEYIDAARAQLAVPVYGLQYLVDLPGHIAEEVSSRMRDRELLLADSRHLRQQNLKLQAMLQKFQDLQLENERLRSLLDSTPNVGERVLIAEVLAVEVDPFARKMLINKGTYHGVKKGQPLLDAHGVMGQVIEATHFSSVVMLVTDPDHALPVQIARTGLRTIAVGLGAINRLALLYLPNNADIQPGDRLITSGIGGQFPPGYPVGEVMEVSLDIGQPYAQVQAKPSSLLERNREVLLVWRDEPPLSPPPVPPDDTAPVQP
jgi:rod shape-determining protein MreC